MAEIQNRPESNLHNVRIQTSLFDQVLNGSKLGPQPDYDMANRHLINSGALTNLKLDDMANKLPKEQSSDPLTTSHRKVGGCRSNEDSRPDLCL